MTQSLMTPCGVFAMWRDSNSVVGEVVGLHGSMRSSLWKLFDVNFVQQGGHFDFPRLHFVTERSSVDETGETTEFFLLCERFLYFLFFLFQAIVK